MNLHILSDLHIEFRPFTPSVPDCTDIVILAGDITTRGRAGFWAAANFSQPTLLVGGNHDSYQTSLQRSHRLMRLEAPTHVHFLENQSFLHQGVRFLGCTAWTDFESTGNAQQAMLAAHDQMNDYKMIRYEPKFRRLHPRDTRAIAKASKNWLLEELKKPFVGQTVVITHTPPLRSLLPSDRDLGHSDAAYCNDWLEILQFDIDLWVFGHSHHPIDREISNIHFISNPRGYPDEDLAFRPDLLVAI